jgi:energy-coupling factor transporter ATP-binding protein EcfA2
VIGFQKIAGGMPSSTSAMVNHLFNLTMSQERARVAAYYEKGMVATTAEEAHDIIKEHKVDDHVHMWLDDRAAPNAELLAAYAAAPDAAMSAFDIEDKLREDFQAAISAAERRESGAAELSPEARALHGLLEPDPGPAYLLEKSSKEIAQIRDGFMRQWDAALEREEYQTDVKQSRAPDEAGHLAIVRPDIDPRVLVGLGIDQTRPLTKEEVGALLAGRKADGDFIDNKKYATERQLPVDPKTGERRWSTPIGSYDFCPTPDKSVSVAWGLANNIEQAMIMNAHIEAAREAVGYIGAEIGRARIGNGGEDGWVSGSVGWLEFTHHTARKTMVSVQNGQVVVEPDKEIRGDPGIHTHFLIPNAVFCPDGRVGSLDTAAIRGFIFEADGYYQAKLGQKLRDAGFEVALDERTGAARMTAISDDLRALFSKRTNAGEAMAMLYTRNRGEVWEDLAEPQRQERIKRATQDLDQKVKGGKDDLADFEGWKVQAKDVGWTPGTFQLIGPQLAPLTPEERIKKAYEVALPWLEKRLEHSAVVPHWDLRLAALRGLVQHGIDGLSDIKRTTHEMVKSGVRQYGEMTGLVWGQEEEKRYTSITTSLHESDEREFVRLARAAGDDKTGAISRSILNQQIAKFPDLDFTSDHGKNQRAAMDRVASGSRLNVVVGAAGSGKTTLLKPLVGAWKEQGREVFGASLAWRQADDLVGAGIDKANVKAFSVLMKGLDTGDIKVDQGAVVAIDEWGLLGTRQALQLLRAQERLGFTVVALGDDKQCASIEAGAIIDLSRRALGKDQVPEILTTTRQQTERELEIVDLFRRGEARQALDMKRDDGTAEMAYGGRKGVMERAAELYVERLKETGHAPTVSAPTNSDAHQIGAVIREARREIGLVGEDKVSIKATDGDRNYMLALAAGDRVRLFQSTRADFQDGSTRSIGRNGSVLEVVDVDRQAGLLLRASDGRVGRVEWGTLTDSRGKSGRSMLAYGDATTIHTAQGSSVGEHILVLPSGSRGVTGAQAYTGNTRHKMKSWLITSESAERLAVKESRPINDMHDITVDDKWSNVAKQFSTKTKMDSALALLDRLTNIQRGVVKTMHRTINRTAPHTYSNVRQMVQGRQMNQTMDRAYGHMTRDLGPSISEGLRR